MTDESGQNPSWTRQLVLPVLAVVLGLVAGAILILFTGDNPITAYGGLVAGSLGSAEGIGRTLDKATPLVLGGLAVAFAFKAGLLNIGGQGQLLLGAVFAAWAGFDFDLPAIVHIPVALVIGGLAASLLGALSGYLKAKRGTHEVISTIMLNFVAANFTEWLVSRDGPWKDPDGGAIARTPAILASAEFPRVGELPTGFLVAVLAAVIIWWIVARSTLGFEIQTVGANPNAARYAGISVPRIIIIAMTISAFLAGLGGAIQTQGVIGRFEPGFNTGLGFDGITIALLARTNALAVIPAALLIGALDAGSTLMQSRTDVEPEIISVIQAFILFFVAAPSAVRWLLRLRNAADEPEVQLAGGWGAS